MTVPSTSHDATATLQLHQDFAAAWGRGDTTALLTMFAEDAVRVGAAGDVQRGHAEIVTAYQRLLAGPFIGATVTIDPGTVRFLSADLALWQGGMEITPGADQPSLRGYSVDVMARVGATWLILETHPKLFPPAPR